jgi:hypothetical protein
VGPPLFVPLADEEAMVSAWRDAQAGPEAAVPAAGDEAGEGVPGGRAQRRWWQPHR